MNQVVEYELTPDDYRRFNQYHHANSPTSRRAYWRTWIVTSLLLLFPLGILWFKFEPWVTPWERVSRIWPYLLVAVGIAASYPLLYRRRVNKQIDYLISAQTRGFFGWRRVELNDEGVISSGEHTHQFFKWDGIDRIVEEEEQLLLYLSLHAAIIIPRRDFASSFKYDEFVAAARKFLTPVKVAES